MARRLAEKAPSDSERPAGAENVVDLAAPERLPILLVDDSLENLQALEAVLEPLGLPVLRAGSGGEALRMLLAQDFALILLDVRMPGLDGLETARLIKGRDRNRDVPIVFLTAARDEVSEIIRGYGVGALDYVLKPFDAELLRSKVSVFVELESSRRALQRSEAFLRGAFESAPIGKTVLDESRRIIRANPAFARLLDREPGELQEMVVGELCHPDDRDALSQALDRVSPEEGIDLRLKDGQDSDVWVTAVASSIEPTEYAESLLLVQWVDLTARRRAEQARAELLLEQAARTHAEEIAQRLDKLQTLASALESLSIDELLPELAVRLASLIDAAVVQVRVADQQVQVVEGRVSNPPLSDAELSSAEQWLEAPIQIDRTSVGVIRVSPPRGQRFGAAERSLLHEAAQRAGLSIRRAQLHAEEHRIAVELQKGLLPKELPVVEGIELAVHYEAAGLAAQVGGDWYDAFPLREGRVGVVLGDVAGRGIPAASAMGQLRSLARGFAYGDGQARAPGEVLTRLNRHQLALGSEEMFTVLYAIVDPATSTVTWANAGHPPPLLRSSSDDVSHLEGGDGLMGIEEVEYQDHSRSIGEQATLVLYTDGLIERRGEPLDAGMARLAAAVRSGPAHANELCEHILRHALPEDRELDDDVTAVVIRLSQSAND